MLLRGGGESSSESSDSGSGLSRIGALGGIAALCANNQRGRLRTAPLATTQMPTGIANIISNEAAERFSFYGMKCILVVFMTSHMRNASGEPAFLSEAAAREYYHAFTSAVYFTPLAGAVLAEAVLGKYRTVVYLSMVYCGGHLALALDETRLGLAIGLGLIAIGSGGIKPCVSAVLGDQFGALNQHLVSRTFAYFYLAINFGPSPRRCSHPTSSKLRAPTSPLGYPAWQWRSRLSAFGRVGTSTRTSPRTAGAFARRRAARRVGALSAASSVSSPSLPSFGVCTTRAARLGSCRHRRWIGASGA